MLKTTFGLLALLQVQFVSGEVDLTPEMLEVDDDCNDEDSECQVKLLQLRASKTADEDNSEEEGPHPNLVVFAELDKNMDGEVQPQEAAALLEHKKDLSDEDAMTLFKEQDVNENGALDLVEFNKALESWSTTCSAVHREWFCSGGTRVTCCKRGWAWVECGQAQAHHNSCRGAAGGAMWGGGGGAGVGGGGGGAAWGGGGGGGAMWGPGHGGGSRMTCGAVHREWFCSGSTRITCCKRGWVWEECGHAQMHHRSCR